MAERGHRTPVAAAGLVLLRWSATLKVISVYVAYMSPGLAVCIQSCKASRHWARQNGTLVAIRVSQCGFDQWVLNPPTPIPLRKPLTTSRPPRRSQLRPAFLAHQRPYPTKLPSSPISHIASLDTRFTTLYHALPMDFLNTFFVSDSGGEPVNEKAELEADGHEFADYEKRGTFPCLCVVA